MSVVLALASGVKCHFSCLVFETVSEHTQGTPLREELRGLCCIPPCVVIFLCFCHRRVVVVVVVAFIVASVDDGAPFVGHISGDCTGDCTAVFYTLSWARERGLVESTTGPTCSRRSRFWGHQWS